jgi:hypothetical protein
VAFATDGSRVIGNRACHLKDVDTLCSVLQLSDSAFYPREPTVVAALSRSSVDRMLHPRVLSIAKM